MGGRVVYLAASACSGLSAGVVYYGGAILAPYSDGVTPIDGTGNISIPLMGNFGETDGNPTPADVSQIEAALDAAGKSYDFKMYPGPATASTATTVTAITRLPRKTPRPAPSPSSTST